MIITIKRLNIFIDESGDFGFVKGSSDLYAISFIFHESKFSITDELNCLSEKLNELKYTGMIHLADLIAKRNEYSSFNLEQRKKIFWTLFNFTKKVKIKLETIILDKKYINSTKQLSQNISSELHNLFDKNNKYFKNFDKIVIYYDNGQEKLSNILDTIFSNNQKIERRINFDHTKKKLFQVSDMLTVIDKLDYKRKNNLQFTKSEKYFFNNKDLRNIINNLKNKRI